jgi:hypothetical protein
MSITMNNKLGRITKINPREIWKHEALDFTQWLVKEENIEILCDALDISIENARAEEAAGRFNVDIVADDTDRNAKVIIENQLEKTDHKHLGQLLTYASAFDASIIIWIVTEYTEEHRQAIDWFNRNISEKINFFLVKIEIYQISDSKPAPHFSIICEPNEWGKTFSKSSSGDEISETKLMQRDFWAGLKAYAENTKGISSLGQKARPQHWFHAPIGTSKAHIGCTINTTKNFIRCGINIPNDKEFYYRYYSKKEEIENSLGYELNWREMPNSKASRIVCEFNCDPSDRSSWDELFEWLANRIEEFKAVFGKYN